MMIETSELHPYSLEEGKELVYHARHVVESVTTSPRFNKKVLQEHLYKFTQRHGLFVTIEFYPTKALRGCIGFPQPIGPVSQLLVDAAFAAATEDPRFVPVSKNELEHLIFEVSILTEPQEIKAKSPSAIPKQIKIGRDGLIVRYGYRSGLLLPIVAVEEKWDEEQFLDNVCIKAGLPEHTWKSHDVPISKFSTQVFREKEPKGEVEEVILK
jgi:uncharacterized protein